MSVLKYNNNIKKHGLYLVIYDFNKHCLKLNSMETFANTIMVLGPVVGVSSHVNSDRPTKPHLHVYNNVCLGKHNTMYTHLIYRLSYYNQI